ncbi:MAG: restriction endonuclease subunit S [Candidatus Nitrotoga sp.]|nr:restriction endonuclease subunit S [Candidatus Nitrotoga sp.]
MSKLTHHKFANLYQMASGISSKPDQAGHGAPFLSFSAVFNNYFLPDDLVDRMDTSEHEQKKYSINEGDIFLTRTSEVIDELGMSSVALKCYQKATYSGFLKRLRPLVELEAMAKTLYDYWFVQFDFPDADGKPYKSSGGKMVYNPTLKREIPAGWTDGTLDDLGQIVGGSTPSTTNTGNFAANGTPWITPYDLSGNQENKFITRGAQDVSDEGVKDASLKKYPAGTVLLSSRAPIGYMAIARIELTTNQGFKSFISTNGYSTAFIYYTVKNALKAIMQYASGSTFKEVSGTVLKTVKITLPKSDVIGQFSNAVEPIFGRQDLLEQENQQLTQLRDWLLPMLMNGQVTVA